MTVSFPCLGRANRPRQLTDREANRGDVLLFGCISRAQCCACPMRNIGCGIAGRTGPPPSQAERTARFIRAAPDLERHAGPGSGIQRLSQRPAFLVQPIRSCSRLSLNRLRITNYLASCGPGRVTEARPRCATRKSLRHKVGLGCAVLGDHGWCALLGCHAIAFSLVSWLCAAPFCRSRCRAYPRRTNSGTARRDCASLLVADWAL